MKHLQNCLLLLPLLLLGACAPALHTGYVATTFGDSIYYEERGHGEPLVLLHGHSLDGRMWDEQFRPFSKHFRTIRLDFRGYGKSSPQRERMQFTHADDVLTLMDSLRLPRAHVVGLSMGSFVAGDLVAMHPERLLTCIMASGGIRNSKGPSEPMDSAEWAKRNAEIAALQQKGVEAMKREWTEQLIGSGGTRRERMRRPLQQMITDWTAWQPLHHEVRLFYGKEAWKRLAERQSVGVPTLFLRGANELKGNRKNPREMKYLPNSRFVVIDDCGHMLNMERPKEFNSTVVTFIRQSSRYKNTAPSSIYK